MQNPGVTVFIIAPTLKHAQSLVSKTFPIITRDAPDGLIKRTKSEYRWTTANGSQLILGSFDTATESIRGATAFSIYLEETGFVTTLNEYEYVVNSVLLPTLLHSGGRMTFFTTPPKVPNHPFLTHTVPQAELAGSLFIRDIYANTLLNNDQIEAMCVAMGGPNSIAWKREALCQVVRDETIVVVPEFNEAIHVKPITLPEFCNTWIGGDLGGVTDKTAIYFLAYDFERDVVQVIRELAYDNKTPTSVIAKDLHELEAEAKVKPQKRWLDGSGQTLSDLRIDYKYMASLPEKQDLDAGVNMLRTAFSNGKIEIDPSCTFLIASLRSGTFNKNRTDYLRTDALGHCDAIAGLVYAYRMRIKSNPFPAHLHKSRETHHIPQTKEELRNQQALRSAFKSF